MLRGLFLLALLVAGCSAASVGSDSGPDGARLDATSDGTASDGTAGDASDGNLGCPDNRLPCDGVCCPEGQSCAGGFCCAETERCGGVCCGPNRRCEAETCQLDCGARVRCGTGAAETCCAEGQVCYLEACVTPGPPCSDVMRCPEGQYCEPTLTRCLPRATGEACEYRPPTGVFRPQLKWAWSGDTMAFPTHNQVMMQPVVANLNDDNRDGRIDRNDVPDVVFITFQGSDYWIDGVVRAVSGADGTRLWPAAADPGYRATPGASIAIAELDASSPGPELVTCSSSNPTARTAGHVLVLRADGRLLRRIMDVPCGFSAPAIADMDGDGTPEIAVRNVLFHADGTVLPGYVSATRITAAVTDDDFPTLADLDGDGTQELVLGNRALRLDGRALWTRMANSGYPAVADVDADGRPEVLVVQTGDHAVWALNGQTGTPVWGPVEINHYPTPSGPSGGGPPTVADFNGDGTPDVATAGGYNYLVLNGRTGAPLWFTATQDTSSRRTGSSVFDFEGDGRAEVVYNDELLLRVYRGTDGTVLFSACNTSGTLWEYPVIVDVDNDDHADIVVMQNNYAINRCADGSMSGTGIRVFSDPTGNWVRTRRIWNQHTYHVTNVDEDGVVPRTETPNWSVRGLNNFRQNVQPEGLFDAPDLQPADVDADLSMCSARMTLRARVVNRGRAGAPAGVPVTFYHGDPMGMHTRIGRAVTTRRLLPGESEVVSVAFPIPAGMERATFNVYVVINDPTDMPLEALHECRPMNNTTTPRPFVCLLPG
jgi:hypothetical protein